MEKGGGFRGLEVGTLERSYQTLWLQKQRKAALICFNLPP